MTTRIPTVVRACLALLAMTLCSIPAASGADPGHGVEYGPAQFTNAQSRLAIFPAEPEAHEPIDIEIYIGGNLIAPHVVDIDVDGDDITILYRGSPAFAGPYGGDSLTLHLPEGLAYGDYRLSVLQQGADGSNHIRDLEFSVAEPYGLVEAIGLYSAEINHFFVTASSKEYTSIIHLGWQRLGKGGDFNVWRAEGPAPSTAKPVCRFYSYLVNSHFYTGGPNECESLKDEASGWIYEGIAFQALLPTAGVCPTRTQPVYRLYNGRADELDSNHRFVTSAEMYRALVADGWIGEGIAFCEAPSPPECIVFIGPDPCLAHVSLRSRRGLLS